jgi:hypothetical protein
MEKIEQRFQVGERVKLKDGIDVEPFYGPYARIGQEGIVRKIAYDSYGYPHLFIAWDENEWRWNGQESGWTWATHFEPVDRPPVNHAKDNEEFEAKIRQIALLIRGFIADLDDLL